MYNVTKCSSELSVSQKNPGKKCVTVCHCVSFQKYCLFCLSSSHFLIKFEVHMLAEEVLYSSLISRTWFMSSSEPDSQTVFTCTDVSEGIILWMIMFTAFVHSFADCKLDATFWIWCILRLFVIKTTHCCFDKYIKTGTYNTQDNVLVIHTFYGHFH